MSWLLQKYWKVVEKLLVGNVSDVEDVVGKNRG